LPQNFRRIVVSLCVGEIGEGFVETVLFRGAFSFGRCKSPFPNHGSPVTLSAKHISNGLLVIPEDCTAVLANACMPGCQACEQGSSGRCTDRASRIELGKTNSFSSHLVETWSSNLLLSIT